MAWTHDDPSLFYECEGQGRSILLVHEMGGSSWSWDIVAEQLRRRHRVATFDIRGAGLSEKAPPAFSFEDLAHDVISICQAADLDRPVVCGVAAGAVMALSAAALSPDQIGGLVLCSPALSLDASAREQTLARATAVAEQGMRSIADGALSRTYPESLRGEDYAEYRARFLAQDPASFAQLNRAFAAAEFSLEAVAHPTLVLAGDQDVRPAEAVAQAAAKIPGAVFEIVEGAGHVMARHQPLKLASRIAAFAASLSAPS